MSLARTPVALLMAAALCGCASSMSGVGGTDKYACKAPEGALCTSVSGVYANSLAGPVTTSKETPSGPSAGKRSYGASSIAPLATIPAGSSSLRSNPRVLRVWIAAWEDADGDLHDESFVHVLVDTGRWLIEHVRPAERSRIEAVAPPLPAGEPPRPAPDAVPMTQLPALPGISPDRGEAGVPTER